MVDASSPLNDLLSVFSMHAFVVKNLHTCDSLLLSPPSRNYGKTSFHLVSEGICSLEIVGKENIQLKAGDLVLFPRQMPHKLYDIKKNSTTNKTGALCAYLSFDNPQVNSFLDILPDIVLVPYIEKTKHWIDPLLKLIIIESDSPELPIIINKLSEIIFVRILKYYIDNHQSLGMLDLYTDSLTSVALSAIHKDIAKNWQLEELAGLCGVSRTTLANRFKKLSGMSPIEYLVWWRMQKAWKKLKNREVVIEVAEAVGYQSVSAFSKNFKKIFGIGPGEVRRQHFTEFDPTKIGGNKK
ncbi:AraC family transcriptional regulator [Endozoicomonas sp. SM1973]|uniref:AraC family transcriptional regulator n=1 Tax=Spartinivicinus marinus TaxID=2994442 RepID=A0A853ICW5_9GAMM|nr:AraC family transcriptional regulator [Spartinivicinus marinus]MCX4027798.1 AraC family transcriptional regulator [Spartinivicinus marinus]NYZ69702.1 AraC family transcriptional regulator [Spartinivicinus marinus]